MENVNHTFLKNTFQYLVILTIIIRWNSSETINKKKFKKRMSDTKKYLLRNRISFHIWVKFTQLDVLIKLTRHVSILKYQKNKIPLGSIYLR